MIVVFNWIQEFMDYLTLIQIINLLDYHNCSQKCSIHEYAEATLKNIAKAEMLAQRFLERELEKIQF